MVSRLIGICGLLTCLLPACLADTITFKDGTARKVRIYKKAAGYISYLYEGKIEVVPLDKVKDAKFTDKPLTDKELAEAIKAYREQLKKKVAEEEKKFKVKSSGGAEVISIIDAKKPIKGVKVIDKGKSKTKAIELKIDPFPNHPVKGDKPGRGKAAPKRTKTPAKKSPEKAAPKAQGK